MSKRMGEDKALIPHREGGTWLERTLLLLSKLKSPITLLSRHQSHLNLASSHQAALAVQGVCLEIVAEPAPWEGPLLALNRLMQMHPDQRLLLCAVDMPQLNCKVLKRLIAEAKPAGLYLAHNGNLPQPLLGVYYSDANRRTHLNKIVMAGERSLNGWLNQLAHKTVSLDQAALLNVNQKTDLPNQT